MRDECTCLHCGQFFFRRPSSAICQKYCSFDCHIREKRRRHKATFWQRMDRSGGPDACWIWLDRVDKDGYGKFACDGSRNKRAHRLAWEFTNGPIPPGLCVCHNCPDGDNPSCCNPRHLWLGTNVQNTADRQAKGRHWARAGAENGAARLTWEQVQEIRDSPCITHVEFARRFGCSTAVIYDIRRGKRYVQR